MAVIADNCDLARVEVLESCDLEKLLQLTVFADKVVNPSRSPAVHGSDRFSEVGDLISRLLHGLIRGASPCRDLLDRSIFRKDRDLYQLIFHARFDSYRIKEAQGLDKRINPLSFLSSDLASQRFRAFLLYFSVHRCRRIRFFEEHATSRVSRETGIVHVFQHQVETGQLVWCFRDKLPQFSLHVRQEANQRSAQWKILSLL